MWPIFIINLDRAQDRMSATRALMNRYGLPFIRVAAYDWQTLTDADAQRFVVNPPPRSSKRVLALSEIACFLSHIDVWTQIGGGKSSAAFVFEDDVEFDDSINKLLLEISSREPDWDILKLYSNKVKTLGDAVTLPNGYSYGTPKIIPMSTAAYAITRPAARELARASVPFGRPVDLFIKHWWEHGSCVKLVQPSPMSRRVDHLSSSEIEAGRGQSCLQNFWTRFVRNSLYQLQFRHRTHVNAARRPPGRRWLEATGHPRMVSDELDAI
ncbi:glycosyltransferase family 25 protein [Mesorhizobium sp.]|uniref:glycosyltransferase family 25 protein n=1 Tax=Mesorhizobium sp. TaxID=1871066 RepID=UPI0012017334|nr:glycosyltransferase family 25 protein [Mesorhizobium sp.]TIL64244.1 MAG: glycosyltransferase family 25 protein [Mesorhizobium sp.]